MVSPTAAVLVATAASVQRSLGGCYVGPPSPPSRVCSVITIRPVATTRPAVRQTVPRRHRGRDARLHILCACVCVILPKKKLPCKHCRDFFFDFFLLPHQTTVDFIFIIIIIILFFSTNFCPHAEQYSSGIITNFT